MQYRVCVKGMQCFYFIISFGLFFILLSMKNECNCCMFGSCSKVLVCRWLKVCRFFMCSLIQQLNFLVSSRYFCMVVILCIVFLNLVKFLGVDWFSIMFMVISIGRFSFLGLRMVCIFFIQFLFISCLVWFQQVVVFMFSFLVSLVLLMWLFFCSVLRMCLFMWFSDMMNFFFKYCLL